jgi:hypothetical protein
MLDDLIDGVARQMTASQPSVAFTRRVVARVAQLESKGHRRRWGRLVWLLAAPATVFIVVMAVLVFRDRVVWQPSAGPRSNPTRRTAPAEQMAPEAPVAEATSDTSKVHAHARASDVNARSTPPTMVATSDPDLAPLVTAPLEIVPLGVAPLPRAVPIEVDALSIGHIDIAAMP